MPVRATLPCVLVASIVFVSFTFSGKESSSAESGQALGRWLQALWISPSVLRIVLLISHCSNALALHSAFFRVFSRLLSLYLQDSWGRGERLPTSLSMSWEPALVISCSLLGLGWRDFSVVLFFRQVGKQVQRDSATYPKSHGKGMTLLEPGHMFCKVSQCQHIPKVSSTEGRFAK